MPTYYARGISVHLGAMPLTETITPIIVLKKGDTAKQQCEQAEKKLLGSELLCEERIQFPGDEAGFELNWLGGAPFMQSEAGMGLFENDSEGYPSPSATTVNPANLYRPSAINGTYTPGVQNSMDPLALILHVKLSDKTFISGLDKNNKVHLKVDVFFNGILSSCLFVPPHDIRSGAKSLHQVFAGYRVDFLAERPWVILPPMKSADGSPRKYNSNVSAERRWKDICEALMKEANERGMDREGNVTPSAEFLKALAAMPMPDQAREMQKPGSRAFGIIDVIITAGDGRKVTSGTCYLKAPQRLVDDNFPLKVRHNSEKEEISRLGHANDKEEEDRELLEPSPEVIDVDAEGDSDWDYDPQPKRQALAPHLLSVRPTPIATTRSLQRNPFKDAQIPLIPAPILDTPRPSPAPVASKVPPAVSSFLQQEERMENLLSSPERSRTTHREYESNADHIAHDMVGAVLCGTPQSFYSFPSSSISAARTPQMRRSPYNFQSSDPLLGQATPGGLMDLASFDNPGLLSSPLQHIPMNMNMGMNMNVPFPRSLFSQLSRGTSATPALHSHGLNSTSGAFTEPPRRGSLGSSHTPPSFPAPPWNREISILGRQRAGASNHPAYISNILPGGTSFRHFRPFVPGSLSFPSPHDRRFSMPLPPTGLYTVPTKPRSSRSSQSQAKYTKVIDPKKTRSSFLINRLVISGKNGTILVNHRWATAQRIAAKHNSQVNDHSPDRVSSRGIDASQGSGTYTERPIEPQRSRSTVKLDTSPTAFPSRSIDSNLVMTSSNKRKQNNLQETQGVPSVPATVSLSLLSPSEGEEHNLGENGNRLESPRAPFKGARISLSTTTRTATPQRRTASGTGNVGLQGPKATTFWLEDPEKVLREAAKMRRSGYPTKRKSAPCADGPPTSSRPVNSALNLFDTATSSPLSSPPSSPEPEEGLSTKMNTRSTVMSQSHLMTPTIPQVDGSQERKLAAPSLRKKQTSSMTELASTAVPRLPAKAQSTTKPSPSPNTKKRKAGQRYLEKQPRSPGRLKTVSNPQLNRDCVIAFAESEDKDIERGVLRQVKGERQGVFAEDYVVLATRFFVAGN